MSCTGCRDPASVSMDAPTGIAILFPLAAEPKQWLQLLDLLHPVTGAGEAAALIFLALLPS